MTAHVARIVAAVPVLPASRAAPVARSLPELGDIPIIDIKVRLHVPAADFQAVVGDFHRQMQTPPRLLRSAAGLPVCDCGDVEVVALPEGRHVKDPDDAVMTVHVEGFAKLFARPSRAGHQFVALPSHDASGWSMVVRDGHGCVVQYRQAAGTRMAGATDPAQQRIPKPD